MVNQKRYGGKRKKRRQQTQATNNDSTQIDLVQLVRNNYRHHPYNVNNRNSSRDYTTTRSGGGYNLRSFIKSPISPVEGVPNALEGSAQEFVLDTARDSNHLKLSAPNQSDFKNYMIQDPTNDKKDAVRKSTLEAADLNIQNDLNAITDEAPTCSCYAAQALVANSSSSNDVTTTTTTTTSTITPRSLTSILESSSTSSDHTMSMALSSFNSYAAESYAHNLSRTPSEAFRESALDYNINFDVSSLDHGVNFDVSLDHSINFDISNEAFGLENENLDSWSGQPQELEDNYNNDEGTNDLQLLTSDLAEINADEEAGGDGHHNDAPLEISITIIRNDEEEVVESELSDDGHNADNEES